LNIYSVLLYYSATTLGDTSAAVVCTRHVSTLLRCKQVLAIALGDLPTVFHFSELNETKSMSLPVVHKNPLFFTSATEELGLRSEDCSINALL